MASYTPIYQKRGEAVVPVITIDDAPSAEASAAGHLVDSNGIASALAALEAKIPSDPIDPSGFMHLTGGIDETATGVKTFASKIYGVQGISCERGDIEALHSYSKIYCKGNYGFMGKNYYSMMDPFGAVGVDSEGILHISAIYAVQLRRIQAIQFEDKPGAYAQVEFENLSFGALGNSCVVTVVIYNEVEELVIDWGEVQWPDYMPPDIPLGTSVLTFLLTDGQIFGTVSGLNMGDTHQ